MPPDLDILQSAAALSAAGTPFILITVMGAKGSTPRDPGAKMIWRPGEGGGLTGTVGGGQFEFLVLDAAQKHFQNRTCGTEHYVLGADADQCCGGTMDVFFEYVGYRQRLVIFGAGHVAQCLAALVVPAPIEVIIADDRPDWNTAERFPGARRILGWDDGIGAAVEKPAATLACVMTCSHDTDFDLLRKLLTPRGTSGASGGRPAFTGLIGSRSKRACLFGRLVASGLSEQVVQQVHCPIGVGDTGKEPQLVAISMAAQILLEAKKLATI